VEERALSSWKTYALTLMPEKAVNSYNMHDDLATYIEKHATPEAKKKDKFQTYVNELTSARAAILEKNPSTYFQQIRDVFVPLLDKEVVLTVNQV
jgi:ferritin